MDDGEGFAAAGARHVGFHGLQDVGDRCDHGARSLDPAQGGGFVGVPGRAAYHAAKHGIHGLIKSTALEYATRGIRVNGVAPGIIDTPMLSHMKNAEEGVIEEMMRDVPIKRLGQPEEIAAAVLWLCSEGASFVTGHVIAVDGGYVAR